MTPATLQALRRLLFFSVEEAAELIGGVSPRSWQYWERGERSIPDDVIDTLRDLCAWRAQAIAAAEKQMAEARRTFGSPPDETVLVWYARLADWQSLSGHDALLWRPHCSVIADLLARHNGRAVQFDAHAYSAWRGKRLDNESLRAQWAMTLE